MDACSKDLLIDDDINAIHRYYWKKFITTKS